MERVNPDPPPHPMPAGIPIPNELLSTIFSHLVDRSKSSFLNLLSISHVCSRWRQAAIGSPQLWRSFAFNCNPSRADFGLLNRTILERCGALTLDVGWYYQYPFDPPSNWRELERLQIDKVILDVGEVFHRIRSYTGLTFVLPPVPPHRPAGDGSDAYLLANMEEISLVNVSLAYHPAGWRYLDPELWKYLKHAPLKVLRLTNIWTVPPWLGSPDGHIWPFTRLHTLEVHFPNKDSPPLAPRLWLKILRETPGLVKLCITMKNNGLGDPHRANDGPQKRLLLPHLTEVKLILTPSFLHTIVVGLEAPSLRKISITVYRVACLHRVTQTRAVTTALAQHLVGTLADPTEPASSPQNHMHIVQTTDSTTIGFTTTATPLPDSEQSSAADDSVGLSMTVRGRMKPRMTQTLIDWFPVAPYIKSLRVHLAPEEGSDQEPPVDILAVEYFVGRAKSLRYARYADARGRWDSG